MEKKVIRYLGQATKLARKLDNGASYFFCGILVKGKEVLNFGFNRPRKTHPRAANKYRKIHCELDTILGVAEKDLRGSTMYLVRVGFADREKWMPAKPCCFCQALIRSVGIKAVYYTVAEHVIEKWDVRNDTLRIERGARNEP